MMEVEKEDIMQRLHDLRLWQEQQENRDSNNEAAGILSEEQLQLMQALGMNGNWQPEDYDENFSENEDDQFFHNLEQRINALRSGTASIDESSNVMTTSKNTKQPMTSKSLDETPVHGMQNMDFATTPLRTIDLNQISIGDDLSLDEENGGQPRKHIIKKPFLKKGEGLTSRFKVPPETFNIKNLPKYKYANRNAMSLEQKLPNRNQPKRDIRRNNSCPRLETSNRSNRIAKRLQLEAKENEKKPIPRSKTEPCVPKLSTKNESKEVLKRGPTVNTSSNHVVGAWASALGVPNEDKEKSPQFKILDISHDDAHHRRELDELQSFENNEKRTQNSLPMPSITKQVAIQNALSDLDSDEEDQESRPYNHVQFSSHVDGIEPLETDTETIMSEANVFDYSKTSTPHDKLGFAQFKAKLLQEAVEPLSIQSIAETEKEESFRDDHLMEQRKELSHRNQLLQSHLRQLEKEIQTYQRENASLIKMKQSHEMEKIRLEHDRDEMEARLNDERIRMEVYFHDERMKIKEKQDQLDRKIKETHKPTRKERDEVMKLNERIAQLEAESKAKEVKHGSAQARLRSQVRQLEKQVQEQKLEIDVLKRENKRVEAENVRLRRENNSKMLNEINKNIAKLATQPPAQAIADSLSVKSASKPSSVKSVKNTTVAKVVSHFPYKTDNKKFNKSMPVSRKTPNTSFTESEPDNDTSVCEDDQVNNNDTNKYSSAYFKNSSGKRRSSANNDIPKSSPPEKNRTTSPVLTTEFRKEKTNPDGSKDIYYPNGNLKKISADGMVIKLYYFNKDIKETNLHDGTIRYYYASNNSWETVYTDGRQVLEFADGQIEHRSRDGRIEVHFPNGAKRFVDPSLKDIQESWTYPDGTKVDVYNNDDKILYLPNGQREIHTKDHKRREFPDGSVKILYNDGTQETRYSNGRIRKRDKDGNLTLDTGAVNP